MSKINPDYVIKNIHTGKVYDVFKASVSPTCIIGNFHLQGSQNIIIIGMHLLCDVEFIHEQTNQQSIPRRNQCVTAI